LVRVHPAQQLHFLSYPVVRECREMSEGKYPGENVGSPVYWCGQQASSTVDLVFYTYAVERVVAECTKFITQWSLWRKNCVGWINKNWLPWQRPLGDRNPISQQSSTPAGLPILKIGRGSAPWQPPLRGRNITPDLQLKFYQRCKFREDRFGRFWDNWAEKITKITISKTINRKTSAKHVFPACASHSAGGLIKLIADSKWESDPGTIRLNGSNV